MTLSRRQSMASAERRNQHPHAAVSRRGSVAQHSDVGSRGQRRGTSDGRRTSFFLAVDSEASPPSSPRRRRVLLRSERELIEEAYANNFGVIKRGLPEFLQQIGVQDFMTDAAESEIADLLSVWDDDAVLPCDYVVEVCEVLRRVHIELSQNEDADTLQAYTGCGGGPDEAGCVDADRLRDVFSDFQLQLDLEGMLRIVDTDGSGEIEYDEFKTMMHAFCLDDPDSYLLEQSRIFEMSRRAEGDDDSDDSTRPPEAVVQSRERVAEVLLDTDSDSEVTSASALGSSQHSGSNTPRWMRAREEHDTAVRAANPSKLTELLGRKILSTTAKGRCVNHFVAPAPSATAAARRGPALFSPEIESPQARAPDAVDASAFASINTFSAETMAQSCFSQRFPLNGSVNQAASLSTKATNKFNIKVPTDSAGSSPRPDGGSRSRRSAEARRGPSPLFVHQNHPIDVARQLKECLAELEADYTATIEHQRKQRADNVVRAHQSAHNAGFFVKRKVVSWFLENGQAVPEELNMGAHGGLRMRRRSSLRPATRVPVADDVAVPVKTADRATMGTKNMNKSNIAGTKKRSLEPLPSRRSAKGQDEAPPIKNAFDPPGAEATVDKATPPPHSSSRDDDREHIHLDVDDVAVPTEPVGRAFRAEVPQRAGLRARLAASLRLSPPPLRTAKRNVVDSTMVLDRTRTRTVGSIPTRPIGALKSSASARHRVVEVPLDEFEEPRDVTTKVLSASEVHKLHKRGLHNLL
eukprot:PhM_4_TR13557/c0_g1_i1/m.83424